MIYTQFAMIGLMAGIFLILPESPWWLVRKNKIEKAKKVLTWNYKGVPGFDADHEISIIAATIEQQKRWELESKAQGPFAILTGLNLKRFLIGCYPKVLQQFAGLALFTSYATYFFQLAGNKDPFNVTLILTCVGWYVGRGSERLWEGCGKVGQVGGLRIHRKSKEMTGHLDCRSSTPTADPNPLPL